MNERLEQLAVQAGLWNDMEPTRRSGRYVGYMNVADVEKFAELIIEECMKVADEGMAQVTMKVEWPSYHIKKHFGVEE